MIRGSRETEIWLAARYEQIADHMMLDGEAQKSHSESMSQQSFKNAKAFYDIAQQILRDMPAPTILIDR
jgi:hypothetical protein